MENKNRKPRMYEPWGYQEENNYQSDEIIHENDLDSFFSDTEYVKDDNKIYFYNRDGNEVAELDVSEFVKSDSIIEKTEYKDGILKITFTNGDVITIDLTELLDENEFKDGLTINDHVVKVLIDSTSEPYLSVSEDGVKISGVDAAIQVETDRATAAEEALDAKIDAETARATSAETALDEKIDAETARAESAESDLQAAIEAEGQRAQDAEQVLNEKIDAEETRAKAREDEIETALNAERTRATQTEGQLNHRIDVVNDELDSEESRAQAAEQELKTNLTSEIVDRKADVDAEEARAISAETALGERIDDIISGATPIAKLDELIEKLGYKDNETLTLTNEHEVAFGEYNISHTSEDASGQTIFSVGNGTSENEKSNAIEIMKNGDVYLWVEGDFMNINKLLGQLAHEVYDTDSTHNSHFFDGGN